MARLPLLLSCAVVLVTSFAPEVGASSSPYPATLKIQHGLAMSNAVRALPFGTKLTASEARWIKFRSAGYGVEWGVWKQAGGPPQFPVRSVDGGAHWTVAGPLLATDWVGGGIFYITRVIPEGPSAVAMVSGAVIDVTVDAGRLWYQYVNGADNWSFTSHPVSSHIGLRVGPASYSLLPKASYAIYVLDVVHLQWRRIAQSLS